MYNSMSKTTHVSKIQVFLMTEILWDADFSLKTRIQNMYSRSDEWETCPFY